MNKRALRAFREKVYRFYRARGRDLPWRHTTDPYRILVSEIMLQQTQVDRVIDKYRAFLGRFPAVGVLAGALARDVLAAWQGLGYNRRALTLQRAARVIVEQHGGRIPDTVDELDALPGIGHATACAICAYAFNAPVAYIETNIRSVFIHEFFRGRKRVGDEELLPLVEAALDHANPREWYNALMDYGVFLKAEHGNPSRRSAAHARQSRFEGSDRQIRGAIVREVLRAGKLVRASLASKILMGDDLKRVERITDDLVKEGLLHKRGSTLYI